MLEDLKTLARRHARDDEITVIPGLKLYARDAPSGPIPIVYEPCVCLVLSGAKTTFTGDRRLTYAAGQYLLASVDMPVTGEITRASPAEPYLAISLSLDPAEMAGMLGEPGGAEAAGDALAVGVASPELLAPVARLLALLDRPADIPALAPLAVREIVYRLAVADRTGLAARLGLGDTPTGRLYRTIGWIRRHYAERLRVDAAAARAGMSASAFHRRFKQATALSPVQYQKQVRLLEARRLLLAASGDVAGVGLQVGYDSPTHFSRDYRRQFGRPPGQDADALRAEVRVVGADGLEPPTLSV